MSRSDLGSLILDLAGSVPTVAGTAWVAPNAAVVGSVEMGEESSVWYSAVVRADGDFIRIGARSNVQDGAILHADPGFPVTVGEGVTVGHRAVLQGCTMDDEVLVGMGAMILNGASVGRASIVAAGAVLLAGTEVPPGSLVVGAPARIARSTSEGDLQAIRTNAASYVALTELHETKRTW